MTKYSESRPSLCVLRWCLALGAVGGVLGAGLSGTAAAQTMPAPVSGLTPPPPVSNPAPDPAAARARVQDGVRIAPPADNQDLATQNPPAEAQNPATPVVAPAAPLVVAPTPFGAPASGTPPVFAPAPVVAPPPAVAALREPVMLDHPVVVDTSKLTAGSRTVSLFGIVGQPGEPAQQLQAFLATTDGRLTCPPQTSSDYVCTLSDGTDLAAVALINGAAQARDDAPQAYREQEIQAQAARRGIWANLPAPPDVIRHPIVRDTATFFANNTTYVLDGVIGLGAPYSAQLQGYLAANGDSLSCQPQNIPGRYICVLPDGTDIAKVSLVNGAARVDADAPDAYRVQQLDALNNRRGYWLNPPPAVVMEVRNYVPPTDCCVFVAGDDGADGITYVGGAPTAVIAGETVFLVLAGLAGWGYYDHYHHWHGAPAGYRSHLERYHPEGRGLRGYRQDAAYRSGGHPGGAAPYAGGRPGGGAAPYAGGHPGGGAAPYAGGHPGGGTAPYAGGHPGGGAAPSVGGHPGGGASPYAGGHPGGGAAPYAGGRPGGGAAPSVGGHPGGGAAPYAGGHPGGVAPGVAHSSPTGGGSFVRPSGAGGGAGGGFHPAMGGGGSAPHVAAPAVSHPSVSTGTAVKHH